MDPVIAHLDSWTIAVGVCQVLLVLPGVIVCAARMRDSWWVGLPALGFAIETLLLACLWAMWLGIGGLDRWCAAVFFDPGSLWRWSGVIGIVSICIGVGALAQRSRGGNKRRWAAVVGAGVLLHIVVAIVGETATKYHWHANSYGKPLGVLAIVLPLGHLCGQAAILAGVFGLLGGLRVADMHAGHGVAT